MLLLNGDTRDINACKTSTRLNFFSVLLKPPAMSSRIRSLGHRPSGLVLPGFFALDDPGRRPRAGDDFFCIFFFATGKGHAVRWLNR